MSAAAPVLGIDLGVAKACVAALGADAVPRVLADAGGRLCEPSLVAFQPDGSVLAGAAAEPARTASPAACARCGVRGQPGAAVMTPAGAFYQAQIDAILVDHLRRRAAALLGAPPQRAILTVPVTLPAADRQSRLAAATIAGLRADLLDEPVAVALAYGLDRGPAGRALVFDFGAGKAEAAVLDCPGGVPTVVGVAADLALGGDDADLRLVAWVSATLRASEGVDLAADPVARERLRQAAERARRELTLARETTLAAPGLARAPDGRAVDLAWPLTAAALLEHTADLLHRALALADAALAQAAVRPEDVRHVLLAGGMTRVPLVAEQLAFRFGRPPRVDLAPEEAAALGAAVHGARAAPAPLARRTTAPYESTPAVPRAAPSSPATILGTAPARVARIPTRKMFTAQMPAVAPPGDEPATLVDAAAPPALVDVTVHRLAIATVGGFCDDIVPAAQPLPAERTRLFSTGKDGQRQVRVRLCQGPSRRFAENQALGTIVLDGLPPRPRGQVRIAVTFAVDAEGLLTASARDEQTGQAQALTVQLA